MNELIFESLDLAAERGGDIGQRCFEHFFARSEQAEHLMAHMDSVHRGKMMDEIFRLMLTEDYADEATYLNWEVTNHETAYLVPADTYDDLMLALIDTVREAVGEAWRDDYEQAWRQKTGDLLGEIQRRYRNA